MYSLADYRKIALRRCLRYLAVTFFFILFGGIYEAFSYQVYSYFMLYAFVIPLLLGVLPSLVCAWKRRRPLSPTAAQFYAGGVMALTIASLLKGALDIYGVTNRKLILLPIAGAAMLLASWLSHRRSGAALSSRPEKTV